jgi:hypothetical protein
VPVEFLTDEEAARYGRYSGPLSRPVLGKLFYLDDEDKRLIERRGGCWTCCWRFRPAPGSRTWSGGARPL